MGGLFQKLVCGTPGRIIAASLVSFTISQPVHAQRADPQTVCISDEVAAAFKAQMLNWSMQQAILAKRVESGHEKYLRGPWWIMQNAHALPTYPSGDASRAGQVYWCEADFKYWAIPMAMMSKTEHQFTIEKVAYTVRPSARGLAQPVVELRNLPDSMNTDEKFMGMIDRLSIAGYRASTILAIGKAQAAKTSPGRSSAPVPVKQNSSPSRPRNVAEGLAQIGEQYENELEGEMRRQGMGNIVDAEKARRGKLTPKQRAAEDAWDIGPRKGETMCREENGITRCKTG